MVESSPPRDQKKGKSIVPREELREMSKEKVSFSLRVLEEKLSKGYKPPTIREYNGTSSSNISTVYNILQEYNLPPGILPDNVKSFSIASNGYFVIDLYGECYVDFEYVVYYAPRVSGFLGYGSISNLEGVQIRSYLIWYGVNYIKVDLPYSDFVYIQFG
ncbi:uncharacterized protein LOC121972419 [Zingiber officinale]|uniref:uncharacterized protein LOC121972419 n=1 Tax=Zingiber officinale TaxID=94328 RepID=UPI001C4A76EA|nr:uncharacterized protein LOC121972419 [Zingiber officinale]